MRDHADDSPDGDVTSDEHIPQVFKIVKAVSDNRMSRRDFVKGLAAASVVALGLGVAGCSGDEESQLDTDTKSSREYVDRNKPGFIEAPPGDGPWKTALPTTGQRVYVLSFSYDTNSDLICRVLIGDECAIETEFNASGLPRPQQWVVVPLSEIRSECPALDVGGYMLCTCDEVCACNFVASGPVCYCDYVTVCTCDSVCTCDQVCTCDTEGGGGGGYGGHYWYPY